MAEQTTMDLDQRPEVSVMMITYNQARYIRQALDSVLMQQTNFIFEIVLADDCSTDGTREICIEYQNKYPQQIKLLLRPTNLGAIQNSICSLQALTGKYVAFCEGDDYWTDSLKLQRQRDILCNNPAYAGVFTQVLYVHENRNEWTVSSRLPSEMESVDFGYLLQENVINTCSFMFRKELLDNDPSICALIEKTSVGDYALFLGLATHSKLYYLQEVTAAYRVNAGMTSTWDNFRKISNRILLFSLLAKTYNMKKYRPALYATYKYHYRLMVVICLKDKRYLTAGVCAVRLAVYSFLSWFFKSDYNVIRNDSPGIINTLFCLAAGWLPLKKVKRWLIPKRGQQ